MEIIRGSLDDISRPASSEQTGIRVSSVSLSHSDRLCPTTPFSLVVLTNDAADLQGQSSSEESSSPPDKGQCDVEDTDGEKKDPKLQQAIEEMRRLDEILSAKIYKEQEVRRQRKELKAKLWQELQRHDPEGRSECAHEAVNTRLFLALEAGPEEEDDFEPLFKTQVVQSEKRPDSTSESFEAGREETGEEQCEGSRYGASEAKKTQRDFVKRNIELVSGEGGQVLFTQAEKERLAMLLREIDEEEEEEDSARGADIEEDMWSASVLTGQGYTPQPSDLEQLIDIDSKIRLLLPVEETLSVQSSYTYVSVSQPVTVNAACEAWHQIGFCHGGESGPHQNVITGLVEVEECQVQKRNKASPFI
ncbi:hypothetical protein PAMA_003699 [Pampus argenteus]